MQDFKEFSLNSNLESHPSGQVDVDLVVLLVEQTQTGAVAGSRLRQESCFKLKYKHSLP